MSPLHRFKFDRAREHTSLCFDNNGYPNFRILGFDWSKSLRKFPKFRFGCKFERLSVRLAYLLLVVQLLGTMSVSLEQASDKWPPQRVDSLSNEDWFAAFKRAKASQKDFKVKSIDEFKGLTKLYLSLVNDGQVVNRFHLKTGALIHCVVVSTQRSLAENNAVANPLPSPPSVNPGNSAAPSVQAVAESFGVDGALDDGGNIRSCPDGSFPKLIPKPEDLYRFSTLREFFRKHPEFETPEGAGAGHEWAGALKP